MGLAIEGKWCGYDHDKQEFVRESKLNESD